MSGFEVYGAQQTSSNKGKSNVDFDALNDYVINTVDCVEPATWNGYISYIVDLGTQKQPDGEYDLEDEDKGLSIEELTEKYSEDIENGVIRKFDKSYDSVSKSWITRKFVPQDDRQSFVYAVDFPDIQLNKGQFFGNDEAETKPLRLWSGGQFYNQAKGKMLLQNFIPLRYKNIADKGEKPIFSFGLTSQPHKMAVASGIVKKGDAFAPDNIDKLLGKTMQFEIQIFNKPNPKTGKSYYTEKLKFIGAIQKKDKPFEDTETHMIQFNQENDEKSLKEVRKHILNTIEQATNFEGSAIQQQLLQVRPESFGGGNNKPKEPEKVEDDSDDQW